MRALRKKNSVFVVTRTIYSLHVAKTYRTNRSELNLGKLIGLFNLV